jgi:hypothetical protein
MGEMKGFTPVSTNPLDWAKNLVSSLDPYTRGIAERKLRSAFRRGTSPEYAMNLLKQLSAISTQRTADRLSGMGRFAYIGKQSQDHLISPHILRFRSPLGMPFRTQGRMERAGLPSWIDKTRYRAQYEPQKDTSPRSDFFDELQYPVSTMDQAKEFDLQRKRDKYSAKFRWTMGRKIPQGPASDEERDAEYRRQMREYYAEQERRTSGIYGPEMPSDVAQKRENEKVRRSIRGVENFEYDMMSDYDKRKADLTERYGGDENKAETAYKKELSKNLPKFFKDSKMSSKSLFNLSRGLSALKGASGIVSTVAGVASGITERIIGGADEANKRSVGIENLMNLTGGLSKEEIAAGELAGMSVEQILKTKQRLTLKFGNIQTALKIISDAGAGEDPESRMFLYEALGVDETELAWADIYNKSGRIDPTTEHRKTVARLEEEKYRGMLLRRSGSGFWNTIKGMSSDSWAARSEDEDFNKIVAGLASAPPQPTVYAAGTDGGTTNVDVNFNGPINVNSDDPKEFAAEAVRTGSSGRNIEGILETIDPKRR